MYVDYEIEESKDPKDPLPWKVVAYNTPKPRDRVRGRIIAYSNSEHNAGLFIKALKENP